ncbi:MAG TPA: ribosome maturation factor RimP [Bacilli bacterium]
MEEKLKTVKEIAAKCAEELGMEIISVDFVHEYGMKILRIIARKEPVMSIDDSSALNQKISDELDKYDFFPDEYYLEVSSEGIEKELRTDAEIKAAVGEYICIRTKQKVEGKKELFGDLLAFENNKAMLKADIKGQTKIIEIDRENIAKIRLAVKF